MPRKFILLFFVAFYPLFIFGQTPPIQLKFEDGRINASFSINNRQRTFTLDAIVPSTVKGTAQILSADSTGIVTKKEIRYFDYSCFITSKVTKTAYGLQWDVYITGKDSDWTAPIETSLQWDEPGSLQFWTTWSDNHLNPGNDDWQDPFTPAPFQDLKLMYGGESHLSHNAFVIPIAATFFKDENLGLSFIEALDDTILDLGMHTTSNGLIAYRHNNYRIGSRHTIHIRHQLVFHEADWRSGMAWLKNNYPNYFVPEEPEINNIAGGGAYSSYEGDLDTAKYRQMGFSLNWKASLDFPYMGLFIPPVKNVDEKWLKYKQAGVTIGDGYATISRLNHYAQHLNKMGFHTVGYFNVAEFGNGIIYPYKSAKNIGEEWENPNSFLYQKLKKAMLKPAGELPDWDERPLYSNWEDCIVVDPADSVYHSILLEQAKLYIQKVPASAGICIDRLDWMRFYNSNGNDSISMVGQQKTRSMLLSWFGIIAPIAQMMHAAHKVILCNPLCRRIDLLQHIDGIYDEFGYLPRSLNLCAQMAFFKPIIAWTYSKENLQPDPDAYFQHHLYMGAFLTIPYPGNDHCITPDTSSERYYTDYGMLFTAIKGREWVLAPHVVQVDDNTARANVFKANGKLIIPVVFGGKARSIPVTLRLPYAALGKKKLVIKVLHPGENTWKVLTTTKFADKINLKVPMERGCALVAIN